MQHCPDPERRTRQDAGRLGRGCRRQTLPPPSSVPPMTTSFLLNANATQRGHRCCASPLLDHGLRHREFTEFGLIIELHDCKVYIKMLCNTIAPRPGLPSDNTEVAARCLAGFAETPLASWRRRLAPQAPGMGFACGHFRGWRTSRARPRGPARYASSPLIDALITE